MHKFWIVFGTKDPKQVISCAKYVYVLILLASIELVVVFRASDTTGGKVSVSNSTTL